MSQLVTRVARYIAHRRLFDQGASLVVGVSGGADSLCLLHLLRALAPRMKLRLHVAHLNHGLRGAEADADADFVRELAAEWHIDATVAAEDVQGYAAGHRLALEEAARQVRYAFLARVAAEVGATHIAVGHHADDQAETVLMHFLRGSGVAGLRGMLPAMRLSDYQGVGHDGARLCLVRPLLECSRQAIEAYCAEHGLTPRIDSTNADTRFYRNRLRHELLPILAQYNPRIKEVLARTAEVMAGEHEMIERLAEESLRLLLFDAPEGVIAFEREGWQFYSAGLQRAVIRLAVRRLRPDLCNVGLEHIERAVGTGNEGSQGESATITGGLALYVDGAALQIGPESILPAPLDAASRPFVTEAIEVAPPAKLSLANDWRMEVAALDRDELPRSYHENEHQWIAYLDAERVGDRLTLRPRRPGDRFRPHGMGGHSVRINEFMINRRVPAGERATWPLLVGANGIAWVCGLRIDETAAITADTKRIWRVRFRKWPHPSH